MSLLLLFPHSAAGGGVNVAATTVALTLTENAATITIDRNVLAGTDALVLSTYAATVSVGGNVNVSAGTDSLVLTTYSATIEGSFEVPVVTAAGGRSKPRGRRVYEEIEPIIPETQEIPQIVKRRPKVDVKKYEMVDIPKVISGGWKPKQKKQESLDKKDYEALAQSLPKKEEFDFKALEREAKEALERERKKRIQEQNDLLMMLAMEVL